MTRKLTRNTRNKMVSGVAAGLADYFQLDVSWVRAALLLAILFGGVGLWIYIILWIAIPERNHLYTFHEEPSEPLYGDFVYKKESRRNGSLIAGAVLVILGLYFLLDEFNLIPYWFDFDRLWPLVLVVMGLFLIFRVNNKNNTYQDESVTEEKEEQAPPAEDKNEDI